MTNTSNRPAVFDLLFRLWSCVPSGGALPAHVCSLIVAAFAALASWAKPSRTVQASAVGFGLLSSSAILVHLSGGFIELHFHFFVMLVFLALLQDWIPYLLAVGFVAVHHGVVGVLWPSEVYNHEAAINNPWTFAALLVLWACLGSVIAWRFNERAFAQTAMILEAAGEGIFGLDVDGCVTFMNPAAASMLRVKAAARLVGEPLGRHLQHADADGRTLPEASAPLFLPLRNGTPSYVTEALFQRADGSTFPVDYISTPIIERQRVTGLVVSFRDVTERRRVQADLQRSHNQLEETLAELKAPQRQVLQQERLRAMGQMASGIAHDFYSERGEPLKVAAVDLRSCIEHAVALTQPRWRNQALATGATIQIEVEAVEMPAVAGDSADLREVLTNLIFNAVDAMPNGGTITITALRDRDHVCLEVRDTGCGMTEDVRQRCLEPFFSTKGQHGTGLGLAMVNALVERHRGTLTIDSQLGQGTTFALRLPMYAARDTGVPMDDPGADRSRRLRILVVEDEAVVRRVITEQLTGDGHTVDSATNGVEGLQKFRSGWFDVVVTDRAMPEMGGDQFAAAIHEMAPEKPIIMLTGLGDLMLAKGERPAGVGVVVSKPVTQDQLRRALRQATAAR